MRRALVALLVAVAVAVHCNPLLAQPHDPHAQAAPPTTLQGWADGAQLFAGLGDFHRKITTRSLLTQRYFDQGMRFLWAFNHDEATRSFAKAAQLDPTCASCYWGVALTLGPNYNMPLMAEGRARVGWEAVGKAQANARYASPVEQALIAAVAKRFTGPSPLDPSNSRPLLKNYVDAMRQVASRFPRDVDVQTLFAEGLMNTNPWKLWNADGTPGPGTPEILSALRNVLDRSPRHPGANHYWVHAVEASPHPERALASAEALKGMMPAAGHLDHMPAHILQRVGRYEDAAEANREGATADLAYLKLTAPPDYYPMYLIHNYQFLANSAAMEGRQAETISALRLALQHMPDAMLLAMPGSDWSAGFLYDGMIRFGLWDDMLSEKAPNSKLIGQTISFLQSQATAFAEKGGITQASADLAAAGKLIATVPADAAQGLNLANPLYQTGQLKAQARIDRRMGRVNDAIARLHEAVALEDRLAYNEPSDMFFPVRHLLGALLLDSGRVAEAETVYREDLKQHPGNGWALFGLARAIAEQQRTREATTVRKQFTSAWRNADVQLTASAF
jgi:tetratricopeptide (TPR) repeat protein